MTPILTPFDTLEIYKQVEQNKHKVWKADTMSIEGKIAEKMLVQKHFFSPLMIFDKKIVLETDNKKKFHKVRRELFLMKKCIVIYTGFFKSLENDLVLSADLKESALENSKVLMACIGYSKDLQEFHALFDEIILKHPKAIPFDLILLK